MSRSQLFWCAALFGLLIVTYSNHFQNSFHFDDFHTIANNLYIRSLANVPRFFADGATFSNLPTHQVYRPLLTTTFAFDYVRGGGSVFAFHITSFVLYMLYLAVLFTLFLHVMDGSVLSACNSSFALLATALYGLHPACAETVNYIVQRADLLSTFGVAAGLSLYAWRPRWRRFGAYLLPVALAILVKPPALIFPVILLAFVYLFESHNLVKAFRAVVPSVIVCGLGAALLQFMTAGSFNAGGTSPAIYRITQMYIALHYFWSFFSPTRLNADSDLAPLPGLSDPRAIAGLAFLSAVVAAICFTKDRKETAPIAFGLIWFLAALFPTSWMPLAEVANDHRMFFPFAGLALAGTHTVRIFLASVFERSAVRAAAVAVACGILAVEAQATYRRNEVWKNEETLWRDVTVKSPNNGRGLMNYGLTLMSKGDTAGALRYFDQAHMRLPAWFILECNLAIAKGELGRNAEAEQHFLRALQLEPNRYEPHFFFGRWLLGRNRQSEATMRLQSAVQLNSNTLDARHLLMKVYSEQNQWGALGALAADTLRVVPNDPTALYYSRAAAQRGNELERASALAKSAPTPENYLSLSLMFYRAGRYPECVDAAREALRLRPGYAEAFNNIAAAYNSMQKWDEGIRAADEALRLKPGLELARNNRAWALSQKLTQGAH